MCIGIDRRVVYLHQRTEKKSMHVMHCSTHPLLNAPHRKCVKMRKSILNTIRRFELYLFFSHCHALDTSINENHCILVITDIDY